MSSQIINEIKEGIKINGKSSGINYIKTCNNKEIRDTFSYINEKNMMIFYLGLKIMNMTSLMNVVLLASL